MSNKTAEPEPEQDSEMKELQEMKAELASLRQRFQDIRDKRKKIDEASEMAYDRTFNATKVLLRRAEKQLDQTEKDDIEENARLRAKLKNKFAKKPKAKPKPTKAQILIEMARKQGS